VYFSEGKGLFNSGMFDIEKSFCYVDLFSGYHCPEE